MNKNQTNNLTFKNLENPIILEIKNLKKSYLNGLKKLIIFKNLDFYIKKGESVVITGVSGSGKTTFLNLIGGFDKPDEGEILLNNVNIVELDEYELAKVRNLNIGYVFQSYYLISELNVLENVILPGLKKGVEIKKLKNKAMNLLEKIGLKDRVYYYPYKLSGGERQRVALARALINKPEIILADEPTGNLDRENREIVIRLLKDLTVEYGASLIIATHDETISKIADKHFIIENNKLKLVE